MMPESSGWCIRLRLLVSVKRLPLVPLAWKGGNPMSIS
mgnify:CR=1 FL=1